MKLIKGIGVIVLSVLIFACIGLDCWYIYLHYFGDEKTVDQTVIVSDLSVNRLNELTGEDEVESRVFAEFNVYKNVIEIKFNYFMNEDASDFYSQGIQLILKDGVDLSVTNPDAYSGTYSKEIYSEKYDTKKQQYVFFAGITVNQVIDFYNRVLGVKNYDNFDLYEYQSYDNFTQTSFNTTELQDGNEKFYITLGNNNDEVYGLKFKDYDEKYDSSGSRVLDTLDLTQVGSSLVNTWTDEPAWRNFFMPTMYYDCVEYYRAFDLYYFIESMANSLSSLNASSSDIETFIKMPDIFNFYSIDENKNMTKINLTEDDSTRLYSDFASYFKIKLKINSGEMTKASQSLFNTFEGSMCFDAEPESEDLTDYVVGKTCIIATLDDFDWIQSTAFGVYKFKFSEKFTRFWGDYKNSCKVKVVLDLDAYHLTFGGIILDDDDFEIYEIMKPDGTIISPVEVNDA